jgi:hypothetical protein
MRDLAGSPGSVKDKALWSFFPGGPASASAAHLGRQIRALRYAKRRKRFLRSLEVYLQQLAELAGAWDYVRL